MPEACITRVLHQIDEANREDPTREPGEAGGAPHEFADAQRVTAWIERLAPDASDALRIAARGEHIRRWRIPRASYPAGRAGYLKWRETLKQFHADTVASFMQEAGCAEALIRRVQAIMLRRHLSDDPEAQTLEDAMCLVFLEREFAPMRRATPEPTLTEVVRKTWKKMSPRARSLALALPLPDDDRRWLAQALAER